MIYYNDNDKKVAAWLRQLIADGHLPQGDVDERSICDVSGSDLRGYKQCHFFAGIGGWPFALQLAGWPSDWPVWTGSCPCQPFSTAGRQQGTGDSRHLWPEFKRLIQECNPPAVFGEQVASKLGREWLSGVRTDLEGMGYAVGGADLCAAGVGAPHIRQRLYWVADMCSTGLEERSEQPAREECQATQRSCDAFGVGFTNGNGRIQGKQTCEGLGFRNPTKSASVWDHFDTIQCRDGKARRFEPCSFPLAYGVPGRVGLLRGYGNAIVPQTAKAFIKAFLEVSR